ncbi:MAG: hypothetical protein K0U98_03290 [Deltaproteobacteria bacterium]|nr:hypothetical protein [Deltaproteobacteria bacterium]
MEAHRQPEAEEARNPAATREPILLAWLALAILLTLISHGLRYSQPLVTNGWVSAHFATIAHAYQEHGVFGLGGLPIQNHSPLGLEPDAYLHWPPLFPIVLSWVFAVFGESPMAARGFATFLLLINAALVGWLLRACLSQRAALVGAFTFLCLPIVAIKGEMVMHLHLALAFTLLALLGFVEATKRAQTKRTQTKQNQTKQNQWKSPWPWLGITSMAAAVGTSWEPALATGGLLGLALFRRRRFDLVLAAGYCLTAGVTVFLVMGLYAWQSPGLLEDLWHTVAFRLGLEYSPEQAFQVHTLVNHHSYGSYLQPSLAQVVLTFAERIWANGQLVVTAAGWAVIAGWLHRRRPNIEAGYALGGLATMWVAWFLLMKNHAYNHQYEMYIGAPFLAGSVGVAVASALAHCDVSPSPALRRAARWTLLGVLPATLLFPLVAKGRVNASGPREISHPLLDYAQEIRQAIPQGAVVLSPQTNMIPVYYAERHVVRGVTNWPLVERVREELPRVFPGSLGYLAVDSEHQQDFSSPPSFATEILRSEHLLLFALSLPNDLSFPEDLSLPDGLLLPRGSTTPATSPLQEPKPPQSPQPSHQPNKGATP